ncbi:hypothetical protein, partial [Rhodococcus qingshengii]|uniref:hypothetical protein n=1 Tax=Rhodococcus qingshengii TaxID=334542 RepID=UPI001F393D4A
MGQRQQGSGEHHLGVFVSVFVGACYPPRVDLDALAPAQRPYRLPFLDRTEFDVRWSASAGCARKLLYTVHVILVLQSCDAVIH